MQLQVIPDSFVSRTPGHVFLPNFHFGDQLRVGSYCHGNKTIDIVYDFSDSAMSHAHTLSLLSSTPGFPAVTEDEDALGPAWHSHGCTPKGRGVNGIKVISGS